MNQIPTYLVVIVTQLFIIVILAGGFFFYKWREAVRKGIPEIEPLPEPPSDETVRPNASTYLHMEAKLSEDRYKKIGAQDAEELAVSDNIGREILRLRADILSIEHEFSEDLDERSEVFWKNTVNKFTQLLEKHDLYGALKAPFSNDDDFGIIEMMDDQSQNITQLRDYINTVVKDEKLAKNIELVIDIVEGRQNELTGCLNVLEDQNNFLRDQIQELLHVDD